MQISHIKSAVLLSPALQKLQEIPPAPRHQLPLSLAKASLSRRGEQAQLTINGKSSEEKLSNYFSSLEKNSVCPFSLVFGGAAWCIPECGAGLMLHSAAWVLTPWRQWMEQPPGTGLWAVSLWSLFQLRQAAMPIHLVQWAFSSTFCSELK